MDSFKEPEVARPLTVRTGASRRVRVMIADDHELVRSGFRMLLAELPECVLVGEASDGATAIDVIQTCNPDLVILDVSMPGLSGFEVARWLRKNRPNVKILIVSVHDGQEYVFELIREGVFGYVLKSADREEVRDAIRSVARGNRYYSSPISNLIIEDFVRPASGRVGRSTRPHTLTVREAEILSLIVEGMTSREIAEQLFISRHTVNTHRVNIKKKANVHDTAGLVKFAVRLGLSR